MSSYFLQHLGVSYPRDIPHTSVSLCQPAPLRIQTATSVHTSGSITNVSSSIVRFRPSHNQLTPHGAKVLQARGRWHSTSQILPRSKTKTPNSELFSIHGSFFFFGLHLFIYIWSFYFELGSFHPFLLFLSFSLSQCRISHFSRSHYPFISARPPTK